MAKVLWESFRPDLAHTSGATFYGPIGNTAYQRDSVEAEVTHDMNTSGVFSNIYIRVTTNDRLASTLRFRDDEGNGNGVVTITGSTTGEFEDTSNTDTVAPDDSVNYSLVVGTGGSAFVASIARALYADGTNTVVSYGTIYSDVNLGAASSTRFSALVADAATVTGEAGTQNKFYTGGTLTNLYVTVSANARTTDTVVGTRINGGNGNTLVTIGGGITGIFEDTSNSDTIVSTDLVCMRYTTDTGTETLTFKSIASDFISTTSTATYITGGAGANLAANNTRYVPIAGFYLSTVTDESVTQVLSGVAQTLSKPSVYVGTNSVSDPSSVRLRINGDYGSINVAITASTTGRYEDTTNSDAIAATDEINWEVVSGATGTTLRINQISVLATFGAPPPPVAAIPSQFFQLLGVGT